MVDPLSRLLKRLPIFLILLGSIGAVAIPAAADPHARLEAIEEKQDAIEAKLEAVNADRGRLLDRIAAIDADRLSAEQQLAVLDGRLTRLSMRIEEVKDRLAVTQQRLALLSEHLKDIEADYEARRDLYTARAVATYKAGPSAYLDGILSSETFSDVIDRYEYYESALDADVTLLDEIEALHGEVEMRRDEVNERELAIAADKARLEQDEAALAGVRARRAQNVQLLRDALGLKRQLLSQVEEKKQHFESIRQELERESSQIQAILAAQAAGAGPLPVGGGQLLWPAAGPLTSGFGNRTHPIFGDTRFHAGIDIGAPYGASVIAADAGEVVFTGVLGGYGNAIVVDHGGGLATTYNHLSAFGVGSGQTVSRGQLIGNVGCTGYCTGPHLHFEVRVNGSPVDPLPYLQ